MPFTGSREDDSQGTIGQWSVDEFVKFLQAQFEENPPQKFTVIVVEEAEVVTTLKVLDQIQLTQVQSTVGAAGSAAPLPANPAGYFRVLDYTGQVKLVPYYNP